MKKFAVLLSMLLAVVLLSASAFADTAVTAGQWYEILWSGPVGTQATNEVGYLDAIDPGAPNWTINVGSPMHIFVMDCCASGDAYTIVVNGITLGSTPFNAPGDYCLGVVSVGECVGNPASSQASFDLFPGLNTIQIFVASENSGFDFGDAFFRIDRGAVGSVPEPASMTLLGTGLLGVVSRLRRRK